MTRVVRLPRPAEQVAAHSGSTCYVLTVRGGMARVMIVNGTDGRVRSPRPDRAAAV